MRPKLNEAITMAIASGVPPSMLADVLGSVGWPRVMVNQAVDEWLAKNAQHANKTDFKTWLKKYQKRALPAVGIVVLLGLGQAVFTLLRPWPTKIMVDSALGTIPAPGPLSAYTHQPILIAITSGLTLLIFIFGSAFAWMSDFMLLKIGFWLNRSIKAESFRHILHLPLYHQERLAKGDYVYRQNVVTNSLSDLVLGSTAAIISSVIMIIGVLGIMASFSVSLTLVSIVLMPLLYVTMRFVGPKMGQYSRQLTEINSKTASTINEAVDNAETVQAFTLEDKLLLKVDDLWHAGYRATQRNLMWSNLLRYTNTFFVVLATAIVMYFGGTAAMNNQMTFGQLFVFMTYMGYLLNPVESLVRKITTRYQKIIDVGRVYDVLSDHEGIEDLRKDRQVPPNIQGVIDFQNVSYSYQGRPVFQNLTLHINKGEKVGIIGPSGGGKSTLLKLLPLFVEPQSGSILVDGIDIQSVSLQGLRQKVAWVSQAPQLFAGSILENIYDGDIYRQVNLDEVKHAVEVANVLEFTVKLPMGVNSPAGENGSSLSGGQKQRVAIARSLIKDAPIMCLDEPTAALDAKSENYIRDSLMQIIQNKTVLMATHRKSLLALMDTIYVLDNGVLRNVNELGGLDHYLKLLEGLTEQQIARQIEEDKWFVRPENMAQAGLQDAAEPVARDVTPHNDSKESTSSADARPQIFTLQQTPEEIYASSDSAPGVIVHRKDDWGDIDEVVIKLH
ncbi:ABC transporter ATP-binding protein [Candidatus Saccharibacteria bacterium]|nr:ABC transporter ATP-binding protein [Candidatus Saccharibacteria bacterium]